MSWFWVGFELVLSWFWADFELILSWFWVDFELDFDILKLDGKIKNKKEDKKMRKYFVIYPMIIMVYVYDYLILEYILNILKYSKKNTGLHLI